MCVYFYISVYTYIYIFIFIYTYSGSANALSLDPRVLLARGWSLLKTNSTVAGSCTACVVTLDRCADISVPTVRCFSTSLQKTNSHYCRRMHCLRRHAR